MRVCTHQSHLLVFDNGPEYDGWANFEKSDNHLCVDSHCGPHELSDENFNLLAMWLLGKSSTLHPYHDDLDDQEKEDNLIVEQLRIADDSRPTPEREATDGES